MTECESGAQLNWENSQLPNYATLVFLGFLCKVDESSTCPTGNSPTWTINATYTSALLGGARQSCDFSPGGIADCRAFFLGLGKSIAT